MSNVPNFMPGSLGGSGDPNGIAPAGVGYYTPPPASASPPTQAPHFAGSVGYPTSPVSFAGGSGGVNPVFGPSGDVVAPEYGGQFGDANAVASQLESQAQGFLGRTGPDLSAMQNAPQLSQAISDASAARTAQAAGVNTMATAAQGGGPSAATLGMGSSIAGNLASSYAAGRAGGALGMQAAQGADANANTSAIGQGAAARGNEVLNAQNAYAGAAGNLTSGDINSENLAQTFGIDQAQLQQAQQNENVSAALTGEGQANSVLEDQLQAGTSFSNTLYGNAEQLGTQAINIGSQNYLNTVGGITGGLGGGLNAAGTLFRSGGGGGGGGGGGSGDDGGAGDDGGGGDDDVYSDARLKTNFADASAAGRALGITSTAPRDRGATNFADAFGGVR